MNNLSDQIGAFNGRPLFLITKTSPHSSKQGYLSASFLCDCGERHDHAWKIGDETNAPQSRNIHCSEKAANGRYLLGASDYYYIVIECPNKVEFETKKYRSLVQRKYSFRFVPPNEKPLPVLINDMELDAKQWPGCVSDNAKDMRKWDMPEAWAHIRRGGWAEVYLSLDTINAQFNRRSSERIRQYLLSVTDMKSTKGEVFSGGMIFRSNRVMNEMASTVIHKMVDMFYDAVERREIQWQRWNLPEYAKKYYQDDESLSSIRPDQTMPTPTPVTKPRGIRMREATVQFYEDAKTGSMAIVTDADTPETFLSQCAESLANMVNDDTNVDWGVRFGYWLPQIVETACKLKGYKADVKEKRLIISGELSPAAFTKAFEAGPGLAITLNGAENGKAVKVNGEPVGTGSN